MRIAAITALIAVLVLAGCGDDEDETTTETTAPASATGATGPEAEQLAPPAEAGKDAKSTPGPDGSGDASPREALEGFFTSGIPDLVCGELATDGLLSSAYGDEQGCRQAQVPAAVPDSIEIERLDVSGARAEAVVIPDGGPNDGIETTVTLVDDDGWRVDSLNADVPAGP